MKIIAHIDMNCFYASVEEKYNPELKNTPIAVGGDVSKRHGIVVTSNYVARSFGVRTAMRVGEAKRLCPTLKIVRPNFELYQKTSSEIFSLIREYTENIQILSIDEGYIDITDLDKPIETMAMIQKRIFDELSIPSSVGVSYNKFFAKMASDLKKPLGFTVINKKNFKDILWNLDISKMYGCGKSAVYKLKKNNIITVKDIAQANEALLYSILGTQGLKLKNNANGLGGDKLSYKIERKSIGNSKTFSFDLFDEDDIYREIKLLSEKIFFRASNKNYYGDNISIVIKFNDFKVITRSRKLKKFINGAEEILNSAWQLLLETYDFKKGVRLLGVSLNNIKKKNNISNQIDIFEPKSKKKKKNKLEKAIDLINKKYNKEVVKEIKDNNVLEKEVKNIITTSFSKDFLD